VDVTLAAHHTILTVLLAAGEGGLAGTGVAAVQAHQSGLALVVSLAVLAQSQPVHEHAVPYIGVHDDANLARTTLLIGDALEVVAILLLLLLYLLQLLVRLSWTLQELLLSKAPMPSVA